MHVHRATLRSARWLALLCAVLLCPKPLHALESPGLNWVRLDGAENCVSAAELAAKVEARVGHPLFESPHRAQLFVDGYVAAVQGGWQVTLDVSQRTGNRLGRRILRIQGESCDAIDESVTLVIAITLYPNTRLLDGGIPLDAATTDRLDELFAGEPSHVDPATLPPPSVASPQPPPAPARSRRALTSRRARSAHHVSVGVSVDALLGMGNIPELNRAGALHVWLDSSMLWPIELGASFTLPNTLQVALRPRTNGETRSASVRFGAWASELRTCPYGFDRPAHLHLCGGLELGRVDSSPQGFEDRRGSAADWILNAQAALVWRPRLTGALHLRSALVIALPLVQRTYLYQNEAGGDSELFHASPLSARFELGFAVEF
jgi:hypothetical protein